MNWTIQKKQGQSFVTVVTENEFTLNDHRKMVEDIISRDFWKPGTDILFDHRNLNFGSTGYAEMLQASDTHQKYEAQIGSGKAALVMKTLADFGRGRQFEMLTGGKVSAQLKIFLKETDAAHWLAS